MATDGRRLMPELVQLLDGPAVTDSYGKGVLVEIRGLLSDGSRHGGAS